MKTKEKNLIIKLIKSVCDIKSNYLVLRHGLKKDGKIFFTNFNTWLVLNDNTLIDGVYSRVSIINFLNNPNIIPKPVDIEIDDYPSFEYKKDEEVNLGNIKDFLPIYASHYTNNKIIIGEQYHGFWIDKKNILSCNSHVITMLPHNKIIGIKDFEEVFFKDINIFKHDLNGNFTLAFKDTEPVYCKIDNRDYTLYLKKRDSSLPDYEKVMLDYRKPKFILDINIVSLLKSLKLIKPYLSSYTDNVKVVIISLINGITYIKPMTSDEINSVPTYYLGSGIGKIDRFDFRINYYLLKHYLKYLSLYSTEYEIYADEDQHNYQLFFKHDDLESTFMTMFFTEKDIETKGLAISNTDIANSISIN